VVVSKLTQNRQNSIGKSIENRMHSINTTEQSVLGAVTALVDNCKTQETAQVEALEKVEVLMSSHVSYIAEPLARTGGTPEKRKFDKPDSFSQTRPHDDIMKEAKVKRSKCEKESTKVKPAVLKRDICEVSENNENSTPSSHRKLKSSINRTSCGEVVRNPLLESTNMSN
jgi:hypothetical protein